MRLAGKKIGKFKVATVLANYDLDVRFDMANDVFTIYVPRCPGEAVNSDGGRRDCESFSAPTLDVAKQAVQTFLIDRDKTEFVDVIEYCYVGARRDSRSHLIDVENYVGFEFRVARVSEAKDRSGRPKLEIPIEIDDRGRISVEKDFDGEERRPGAHVMQSCWSTIAFTVERWSKCCAIRDGIAALDELLFELLGEDEGSAAKLDAVGNNPLLPAAEDERRG